MAHLLTGDTVIEFTLPAPDGQIYSTHEILTAAKALVVVFISNDCSYVQAWEECINALARDYNVQDVRVLAINANTGPANTLESMGKYAIEKAFVFPCVKDETLLVTHAFGAEQTPEVFIFDASAKLRYHGAPDNTYQSPQTVKRNYMRDALDAIILDEDVAISETEVVGCAIE